jgi:antitoxin CptB
VGKPSSILTDGVAKAPISEGERELLAKLEWRCRRGMKELDFLLLRYLRRLPADSSHELRAFAEFLELPDPLLARYLIAGDIPQDSAQAAVRRAVLEN